MIDATSPGATDRICFPFGDKYKQELPAGAHSHVSLVPSMFRCVVPTLDGSVLALVFDAYRLAHVITDCFVNGFRFATDGDKVWLAPHQNAVLAVVHCIHDLTPCSPSQSEVPSIPLTVPTVPRQAGVQLAGVQLE